MSYDPMSFMNFSNGLQTNPMIPQVPTDTSSLMSMGTYGANQAGLGPSSFNFSGGQPSAGGGWSWFDQMNSDGTKSQGAAAPILGAAQGLLSAFMGMKQYGLAKDSLAEGKRQFALNYDAQRQTTNTALEDRQRARVASNAGAYQSVGDYMSANGIKQ